MIIANIYVCNTRVVYRFSLRRKNPGHPWFPNCSVMSQSLKWYRQNIRGSENLQTPRRLLLSGVTEDKVLWTPVTNVCYSTFSTNIVLFSAVFIFDLKYRHALTPAMVRVFQKTRIAAKIETCFMFWILKSGLYSLPDLSQWEV